MKLIFIIFMLLLFILAETIHEVGRFIFAPLISN
jgi:hypothetical protein